MHRFQHEMIHAYLFVTNNNRDRDGHGPEFHKHMYRINKEAGTNITVRQLITTEEFPLVFHCFLLFDFKLQTFKLPSLYTQLPLI